MSKEETESKRKITAFYKNKKTEREEEEEEDLDQIAESLTRYITETPNSCCLRRRI